MKEGAGTHKEKVAAAPKLNDKLVAVAVKSPEPASSKKREFPPLSGPSKSNILVPSFNNRFQSTIFVPVRLPIVPSVTISPWTPLTTAGLIS